MALLDVLRARTERRDRTAQVSCGELGLLSVEALPPAELARLQSDRAVLYTACRELQTAGESLRRAGKLFTPDEITAYLSDEEAASGAAVVRDISGVPRDRTDAGDDGQAAVGETGALDTETAGPDAGTAGTESGEIRLHSVQEKNNVYSENRHEPKTGSPRVRPDSVQEKGKIRTSVGPDFPEIRLPSVQEEPEASASDSGAKSPQTKHGQDSREFSGNGSESGETDKKSLGLVDLPGDRTPNLGQNPARPGDSGLSAVHEIKSESPENLHEIASESGGFQGGTLHETTSDFLERMHETTSESGGNSTVLPHEIKSELREILHETESEHRAGTGEGMHEIKSESPTYNGRVVHETKSDSPEADLEKTNAVMRDFPKTMHEITSESKLSGDELLHETESESRETVHEIRSEVREILHEMESELTDRVARSILDGLRRAAAVR